MPVYNNFSCPSGETLAAGRYFSTPAPGMRMNVNKNNASDVDYDFAFTGRTAPPWDNWWNGYGYSRSFESMAGAWNGQIFMAQYGTKGGISLGRGGHGGQQGQFRYIYDLGTDMWSQVGAPGNLPANMAWAGFLTSNSSTYTSASDLRDPNWFDYPYNGGYILLHDHSYNTEQYISPANGGGVKGSILIPSAPKTQNPSDYPSQWAPHLMDLNTGVITRAMTAPTGRAMEDNNQYVSVEDTKRNRLWYFKHGSTQCWYHDLAGGPPFIDNIHVIRKTNGTVTDTYIPGYGRAWEYSEEADALICVNSGADGFNIGFNFYIFDMSTGVPVDIQRSDLPAYSFYHGGWAVCLTWCPPQQAFYMYEGMGDEYCTVLRPSSLNFTTCSWAFSKELFGGPLPPNRNGTGSQTTLEAPYRRFVWAPKLGCFVWQDGPNSTGVCRDGVTRNGIVQRWRPPGTVIA